VDELSDEPKRRAALRRQRQSFFGKIIVFCTIAAVMGSGLVAYNTSRFILTDRNNVTAYIPDTILTDAPGSALVMLTDGHGTPLAGEPVTVEVTRDGTMVWMEIAMTDEGGVATPSFTGLSITGSSEVTVRGAGEVLTKKVTVETTTRIFLQTDKPIYQPGQVVHIRTLAFSGTSPTVSLHNVTLEISTPVGDRIFRKILAPDEYGIASYDYQLGTRLPLGLYKIKATVGSESTEKAFGVQRYVLPRFVIEFRDMRGWYGFADDIDGRVCVDYVFGEHVQGTATLSVRAFMGDWHDVTVVTQSLSNGCMSFHIPAADLPHDGATGYAELKATATDTAGHSESKTKDVPLSSTPILITALADTNVPGAQSNYYIVARWPDGTPVSSAQVRYNSGGYRDTTTDARGVALVSFTYQGQDSLSITVTKGNYSSTLSTGLRSEPGIKVVADKAHYEVGETANFQVYFSDSTLTNWVYYEVVARNFVIMTSRVTLTGGTSSFSMQIDRSMVPLAGVRVYKTLSDLTVSRDNVVFTVGTFSNLNVSITADEQEYRPGEDVRLDFAVSDGTQPSAAALGITIVDKAVYEVDERFKGLEDALKGESEDISYDSQVIDYVYGERSIPPDAGAPLIVSPESAAAGQMQSTLPVKRQMAAQAQSAAISFFWSTLLFIGLAGYVGLVVLGIRSRKYAAVVVALAVMVPAFAALGYFAQRNYTSFPSDSGFGGTLLGSGSSGAGMGFPAAGEPVLLGGGNERWFYGDQGGQTGITGGLIAAPARVRTFFPETWYWNPSLIVGPDGLGNVTLPAPDSITTWMVDAVASTKDAKFGSASSEVRVFQDFFVEPDIPVAAVKNDTFDLDVSVFNYVSDLNATNNVTVQLMPDSWFTITGPSQKSLSLPPFSVLSTYFTITATEIGEHNVTVLAGNARISDAVVRVIRVDPRGSPTDETFGGRLTGSETKSVTLVLRTDRIPGTESASLRIQPSMAAAVLDGADNYIHYVSGCGEQSMSTLNIDVLAFRLVLEGTSDQRMLELEQIVNQGVQHEMQFLVPAQNGQGRGIVWFPGDQDAHPWLTSWGLITFKDAIDAGFGVDEKVLTDMQSWLASIQNSDGSWQFPEWGIYEFNNPILKSKQIATTAYIARALVYSGYPADGPAVQKALGYVQSKVHDSWDDPYMLALSLLVLVDGGGPASLRGEIATRLVELKQVDNGTAYWKSPSSLLSDGNYRWGGYLGAYDSRTSETTGYVVMALQKQSGITGDVSAGVEFLLSRRNEFGGYLSTQDTVVALQALLAIGSGSAADNLDVTVEIGGATVGSVHFDQTSRDITYMLDITSHLGTVTLVNISSIGAGSVVYQVVLSQYIPWDEVVQPPCELCFDLSYSDTAIQVGERITANAELTYNGEAPQLKMVLVTIKSGVGLTFDAAALDAMVSNQTYANGTISLYELGENSVVLYLQNINKGETLRFSLILIGSTPFLGTIEGCQAQDLYDPGLVTVIQPVQMTVTR